MSILSVAKTLKLAKPLPPAPYGAGGIRFTHSPIAHAPEVLK
ncbi:hypothetical protein TM5383_00477 [Thalassovita mediterranea]|jgi:hypothetical protein|uniref:Uncharacterized protein n=1 Tax=Thalassovita mediterranea TaxID=340021 RepID=A0A0P1H028_9RHOB|nr:hypothetical protein TM5383_00477 [Thalassovita mediterranea]SIS33870.1 hypothetical protein SAMN05421685_10929 [Thalassovita mediterranea]